MLKLEKFGGVIFGGGGLRLFNGRFCCCSLDSNDDDSVDFEPDLPLKRLDFWFQFDG